MTNSVGISVGNETVGSSIRSAGSEVADASVDEGASVVVLSKRVESSPPHAAIKRVDESVSARRARDVRDDICNTLAVLG
jgi:methylmalonyl-CoA mutase cobalamin-binding subunit